MNFEYSTLISWIVFTFFVLGLYYRVSAMIKDEKDVFEASYKKVLQYKENNEHKDLTIASVLESNNPDVLYSIMMLKKRQSLSLHIFFIILLGLAGVLFMSFPFLSIVNICVILMHLNMSINDIVYRFKNKRIDKMIKKLGEKTTNN